LAQNEQRQNLFSSGESAESVKSYFSSFAKQWPGVEVSDPCINECKRFTHPPYHQAVYSEGPYFGYRYFDLHKVQPVFPFGFGLSYTNFSWSNFAVSQAADAVNFSLLVSNVGTVTGKDVVQIYVSFPAKYTTQPIKQLKVSKRNCVTLV
jgi:hypothetical protein